MMVMSSFDNFRIVGENLIEKTKQLPLPFLIVAASQTGIQALELVHKHRPDILITDIRMPVMNGLDIGENYKNEIILNLIPQYLNYSPSYLTKIFVQQYGCTPSKYIISLRMQTAQKLLIHETSLSVHQIGELVGYPDQGYFSRIFKKQTGVDPNIYSSTILRACVSVPFSILSYFLPFC